MEGTQEVSFLIFKDEKIKNHQLNWWKMITLNYIHLDYNLLNYYFH